MKKIGRAALLILMFAFVFCWPSVQEKVLADDEHFFWDAKMTRAVADNVEDEDGVIRYVNGSVKKEDGKKVDYKTATIYTDLVAPTYTNAKGKKATGKILVSIRTSDVEPTVKNNKIKAEAEATKIATATYGKKGKNGFLTIRAKGKGQVFVWVVTLTEKDTIESSACIPVEIREAPTKALIQSAECSDDPDSATKLSKIQLLANQDSKMTFYINPTVYDKGIKNRRPVEKSEFTISVLGGMDKYVKIDPVSNNDTYPYAYEVTPLGLKNGKKTDITIKAVCNHNNTSVSILLTIDNAVKEMKFEKEDAGDDSFKLTSEAGKSSVELSNADIVTRTVKIKEVVKMEDGNTSVSSYTAKIYSLPQIEDEDGNKCYEIDQKGKVKVTGKLTSMQKRVSMSLCNGSKDTFQITAAQGTLNGTKAYFLVYHNEKAYQEVTVTVGDSTKRGNEDPLWLNAINEKKMTMLYPQIQATNYTNANGKTVAGRIVWVVTIDDAEVEFNETNHTVKTKSNTTYVTVSNGLVTAKAVGTVYVHACDTGALTQESFEVKIINTPSTIHTYMTADASVADGDKDDRSTEAAPGDTVDIYVKGTIGSGKSSEVIDKIGEDAIKYECSVSNAKQEGYVTITPKGDAQFAVKVADDIVDQAKIKEGKSVTISLAIACPNGKKATFKIIVEN